MENIIPKLLSKSQEAFLLAIEIYNKPTIRYRIEGFSLFICNAWELMLKAHLINKSGEKSIYYKDNPDRTLSLENCISTIFTNKKAPLRLNLEKIIELRNISTHFITEEYEMVYIPLFQSCIFNYVEKLSEFHGIDITQIIPQNFLTLTVSMKSFNETELRAKYPEEMAERLISLNDHISMMAKENNQDFSIEINHYHYLTKDKNAATSIVHIERDAATPVKIIKELKDPNETHKYTMKGCLKEINRRLEKNAIDLTLNRYHFGLFCDYYNLKENPVFCYVNRITTAPTYSYSMQTIELIVEEIRKDPDNIIGNLKEKVKK